jgi:hypothetical protein
LPPNRAGTLKPLTWPSAESAHRDAWLRRDFDVYGEGGFYDAVNVDTGQVSRFWLALDQGMVMAALGTSWPATGSGGTSARKRSSGRSGPCWPGRGSPPPADTCLDCPEGVVFARREPHGRRSI